jgi:hypothetical protein
MPQIVQEALWPESFAMSLVSKGLREMMIGKRKEVREIA